MRQWLIYTLKALLLWLEGPPVLPPVLPLSEIAEAALPLVRAQMTIDSSGESKRHQAYAALIKQFPTVSKRVLSRAIEDAVERL